jgi:hypothetical protein
MAKRLFRSKYPDLWSFSNSNMYSRKCTTHFLLLCIKSL